MNMALSEDQQFRSDWYAGTACRTMTLVVTARRRVSHGARRRRGKIGRRVVTLARCAWSAEPTNRAVPLGQRLYASPVAPLLVVASHSSAPRSCHPPSSRLGEGRRMTLLGPGLEDAARDIPHCTLIDDRPETSICGATPGDAAFQAAGPRFVVSSQPLAALPWSGALGSAFLFSAVHVFWWKRS